jgi:hypothetical protein
MACAQREYDCFRALLAPNMSDEYQQMMNQTGLQVERSMTLLSSIVMKCKGLDEDDPAYAPFTLHLHEMQPKNIYVDKKDPSQIVSVVRLTILRILLKHLTRSLSWTGKTLQRNHCGIARFQAGSPAACMPIPRIRSEKM